MKYRIKISRQVKADVDTLPGNMRQRVRRAIAQLADNPRPATTKALSGDLRGHYRLRVENYRIIYTIHEDVIIVEVVRVAKRSATNL